MTAERIPSRTAGVASGPLGVPGSMTSPLYDIDLSYEANQLGPRQAPPPVPDEVVGANLERSLMGFPVGYPIGVPASPLTANSTWIKACAAQGFNVLTYKTVRSAATPALPAPNWLFAQGLINPLEVEAAIGPVSVDRDRRRPPDPQAYSMVNSCGIPSTEPSEWEHDIQLSLQALREGQILIVSVVGDYERLEGQPLVDDFVDVAERVEAAGARAVELNLSCPNSVSRRSEDLLPPICSSAQDSAVIVEAVRSALSPKTKLVAKLGYLPRPKLEELLVRLVDSVDAISGINTLQVDVNDDERGPVFLGTLENPAEPRRRAGLSGIAIRNYALEFVHSLALLRRKHRWHFEIIGMGGVMEPHDVRALMAMGADAVQTTTAAENKPGLPRELCGDGHPVPSPEERLAGLVLGAIDDPRWTFRTIESLAAELAVAPDKVQKILESHPDSVRRSVLHDRSGRDLYVSRSRTPTFRERLEQLRWILAR